jgi:divalent metal cation (Fe/Co/Zn/Cd) transporter
VDFHVQVDDTLDVRTAHDLASSIEYEIEVALGCTDGGNATAHIEPWDEPAVANG